MTCSGCPHNAHYGRCYVVAQSCGCQVELAPLPFKEGAEWGGAGWQRFPDDVHEDWEETGETGSLFVQEIERDHERD